MPETAKIKWTADVVRDIRGFTTIRHDDGTDTGDIGEQPIATVYDPRNAPVVVAAPELLEACRTALENLAPTYCSDHLVMKRLRAAIAKAEGSAS